MFRTSWVEFFLNIWGRKFRVEIFLNTLDRFFSNNSGPEFFERFRSKIIRTFQFQNFSNLGREFLGHSEPKISRTFWVEFLSNILGRSFLEHCGSEIFSNISIRKFFELGSKFFRALAELFLNFLGLFFPNILGRKFFKHFESEIFRTFWTENFSNLSSWFFPIISGRNRFEFRPKIFRSI